MTASWQRGPALRVRATYARFARTVRFLCVGSGATLLQYVLLVALVESGAAGGLGASQAGYLAGAAFSYFANYWWTFDSGRPHRSAVARFACMAAFGFALNAALMGGLHVLAGLHYLPAQVLATALGLVVNYLLASRWVYVAALPVPPRPAAENAE